MLSNSTRRDIPTMGTGPEVKDYYAVNVATGEVLQLSNDGQATPVALVAVEPGDDAQQRARQLATQAPPLLDVIDYARSPTLSSIVRDSPSIRAIARLAQA